MDINYYDYIIIGAGITGLTTAYRLLKRGKKVVVIEKTGRVGGQIESIHADGYTFETGPNTAVLSHPEVATLFDELRGDCEIDIAENSAKRRLIWKKERFHAIPSGLGSAITTPLFTFYDKFRILGEPFRKKGGNPHESIGELAQRRLGKSFLNYAVDPFLSGVYAGDPMTLTTKYALPKLYNLEQEYGSFIKGAIAKSKIKLSDYQKLATKEVFSAKGGFLSLVKALQTKIGDENIILNCEKTTVSPDETGYKIESSILGEKRSYYAANVITTCGAYELSQMLPFVLPQDLEPITSLFYAPVVQVSLGVEDGEAITPAFGGLVPTCEKKPILGILFPSACFKGRTPLGGELYSIFMGGVKRPEIFDMSDGEIEKIATESLKEMLYGGKDIKIKVLSIARHKKAIPQYCSTTEQRYAAIEKIEREYPNLFIAGNLRDGIGMADRIKQGFDLAKSKSKTSK